MSSADKLNEMERSIVAALGISPKDYKLAKQLRSKGGGDEITTISDPTMSNDLTMSISIGRDYARIDNFGGGGGGGGSGGSMIAAVGPGVYRDAPAVQQPSPPPKPIQTAPPSKPMQTEPLGGHRRIKVKG